MLIGMSVVLNARSGSAAACPRMRPAARARTRFGRSCPAPENRVRASAGLLVLKRRSQPRLGPGSRRFADTVRAAESLATVGRGTGG